MTQVTPQMLTDAGNAATNAGETISLNLTRLLYEIETQAKGFQGGAGSTFQNVTGELGQELTQLLKALNEMAENVHGANRHFGTTDEDAANEIQKVAQEHGAGYAGIGNQLRGH
ncbi:WXG100 family type VII secretion target [Longispora fulva]|uniref:WXG100 family type VII secretion target n=1 Tax=Longispora fulva TaxID=619741 RepID=A0A8J7H323_9ACTN|nr:WXG100 family type VII secretion target [Longispora fulva]MBG6140578.1 WXG100 family type VII secretion target [Longispora fulva]